MRGSFAALRMTALDPLDDGVEGSGGAVSGVEVANSFDYGLLFVFAEFGVDG
jgi:hypothetical protein